MVSGTTERSGVGKLVGAVVALAALYVLPSLVIFPLVDYANDSDSLSLLVELIVASMSVGALCLLGGTHMLDYERGDFARVWKYTGPIMVVSLVLGALSIFEYVSSGTEVSPYWLSKLALYTMLCLGIGFYEESYCRGIALGGLLSAFGRTRAGFMGSVLATAVFFGSLHISWGALDFSSASQLAQALLKMTQTGMYSVCLSAAILESNRLSGAAFFHGLDDFLVMFGPYVLFGVEQDTNYVSSGEDGALMIGMYVVLVLLYLPSFIKALRALIIMPLPRRGGLYGEGALPARELEVAYRAVVDARSADRAVARSYFDQWVAYYKSLEAYQGQQAWAAQQAPAARQAWPAQPQQVSSAHPAHQAPVAPAGQPMRVMPVPPEGYVPNPTRVAATQAPAPVAFVRPQPPVPPQAHPDAASSGLPTPPLGWAR